MLTSFIHLRTMRVEVKLNRVFLFKYNILAANFKYWYVMRGLDWYDIYTRISQHTSSFIIGKFIIGAL